MTLKVKVIITLLGAYSQWLGVSTVINSSRFPYAFSLLEYSFHVAQLQIEFKLSQPWRFLAWTVPENPGLKGRLNNEIPDSSYCKKRKRYRGLTIGKHTTRIFFSMLETGPGTDDQAARTGRETGKKTATAAGQNSEHRSVKNVQRAPGKKRIKGWNPTFSYC